MSSFDGTMFQYLLKGSNWREKKEAVDMFMLHHTKLCECCLYLLNVPQAFLSLEGIMTTGGWGGGGQECSLLEIRGLSVKMYHWGITLPIGSSILGCIHRRKK